MVKRERAKILQTNKYYICVSFIYKKKIDKKTQTEYSATIFLSEKLIKISKKIGTYFYDTNENRYCSMVDTEDNHLFFGSSMDGKYTSILELSEEDKERHWPKMIRGDI